VRETCLVLVVAFVGEKESGERIFSAYTLTKFGCFSAIDLLFLKKKNFIKQS